MMPEEVSIVVCVAFVLFLWLSSVLSVEAVADFVSPTYEKGSDCLKLQFNMTVVQKADCEAIQIHNGTGKLLYSRVTSKGKEAVHPGGKCGDINITTKTVDKDAVNVCGFPADMCSEACLLDIICQPKEDAGVNGPRMKVNVSEYMCSESQGSGIPTPAAGVNTSSTSKPVTGGTRKPPGKEKRPPLPKQDGGDSRILVAVLVPLAFLFVIVVVLVSIFHRALRTRFGNKNPRPDSSEDPQL